MRPDRSHWLLMPLFLLPLVVGAALAYWADRDYQSRMDRTEEQSAYWIQRAVTGSRRTFWWGVGEARPAAQLFRRSGEDWSILVVHRDFGVAPEWATWRVGVHLPKGASAAELVDPNRRIALELGSTDAPAPLFARLLREPDLAALRDADLPASTKLYLFDRTTQEFMGRATVRTMLRLAAAREFAPPFQRLGLQRVDGGFLFRRGFTGKLVGLSGYAEDMTLIPDGVSIPYRSRNSGTLWKIGYGVEAPKDAMWSRQSIEPVSGCWWMKPRYGSSWTAVPAYRKWIPVYAGLSLAFLAFPIALGLAMRRRRQLDAARVRFLTEIAHDLRTPLTSVRLHAELLARSDKNRDKYLGILERESVRAGDLLGNLLDLSRLERGARKFELEPVDVAEVSSACADEFRRLYPERAEDLELQGSMDRVRADRTALARCLRNLLDNAGKYTEPGTPIWLRWSEGTLRIEDRGAGVPEPSRAFDRYVRGPNTDGISGTGLGLSLVRELVEGMGGTIQYRGGRSGAVFEIMLPKVNDA